MSEPTKMSRWDPEQGVDQDTDLNGLFSRSLTALAGEHPKGATKVQGFPAPSSHGPVIDKAPGLIMTDRMEEMGHPLTHLLRWHISHGLDAFKSGWDMSKGPENNDARGETLENDYVDKIFGPMMEHGESAGHEFNGEEADNFLQHAFRAASGLPNPSEPLLHASGLLKTNRNQSPSSFPEVVYSLARFPRDARNPLRERSSAHPVYRNIVGRAIRGLRAYHKSFVEHMKPRE